MRILFFAQAADAAGTREASLPFPGGDAEALWTELLRAYPRLAPLRATTRLARNGQYAAPGERFAEGDVVALIPPVSGG